MNSENATTAARVEPIVRRGFVVQRSMCNTCIFRDESPLNLQQLLNDISDARGDFTGHRICHHSDDACCAGFWARHKDDFPMGQIAQRLGIVTLVDDDTFR